MSMQSLESALRDAAADLPPDPDGVYATVVRGAHRRRVRRRAVATVPVLVAVLAFGFAVLPRTGSGRDHLVVTGSTPAPTTQWHPPAIREGDHVVVTLRLLTGGSLELVLPASVDPATMDAYEPGGAVYWTGQPDLGRDVEVRRGTVEALYAGWTLLQTYHEADGKQVRLYQGDANDVDWLVFQIGDWVVSVWDYPAGDARGAAMTDQQRHLWATHLRGYQTPDGFLVLHPLAPLTSVENTDAPDASLRLGGDLVNVLFRPCQPDELAGPRDARGFVSHTYADSGAWVCDPQVPLVVSVSGSPEWEHDVAANFDLRNLTGPLPSER